tara:strand:- start:126 stop:1022 length:897 start_codon:yes stop_codon:yes gene_type:complete
MSKKYSTSKNLSTIVEDIYETLSCLCESEELQIPDEDIEEFGERIKVVLKSWSKPHKDRTNLRMSIIGRPLRRLWYDLKNGNLAHKRNHPSVFIKFLYGHILEELVLLLVKLSGHTVEDEQKEISVDGVKGHMDCKIDGEVVDIKTASSFAFKKFSEGTLHDDDPFGYMAQLAGYEEAEGTGDGGFLAMNKESGELALYQPGPFVKVNIKDKIKSVREAESLDSPPEKCYNPIPDGKRGNMKLPRGCVYCPYKMECHSDANNGQGLRAFQYSTGLKYFTRLVSMPKVLEVTFRERQKV